MKHSDSNSWEKYWGRKPKSGHLKFFGCLACVKNRRRQKSKFDTIALNHVFLGYQISSTSDLLQNSETRKRKRAKNVVFNEKKVVGLRNELTEQKRELFFDVTFEDEHKTGDSPNFVTIDIREDNPETEINAEVLADEETSLSSETENQINFKTTVSINSKNEVGPDNHVESTRKFTSTTEVQATTLLPKSSVGPKPSRPSNYFVLRERLYQAGDFQQTPRIKRQRMNMPNRLQLTGHCLEIAFPSSEEVLEDRCDKNYEMKEARREAKALKRENGSRNAPER